MIGSATESTIVINDRLVSSAGLQWSFGVTLHITVSASGELNFTTIDTSIGCR